jgi:hypothetical protein
MGSINVRADAFCADELGNSSYHRTVICPNNLKEIARDTFCYRQTNKSSIEYLNHCLEKNKQEVFVAGSSDEKICRSIINKNGSINSDHELAINEADKRDLTITDCKILTDRYTQEERAYIQEQLALLKKKERIKQFKSDCKDIGFTDGTEAMGNCVLKLMELGGANSPTTFTTTSSNASNEIVDIERQKLQAQREALKLQQDQLKAEQQRVEQERRKALKKQADQSIKQGLCLMSGGSYAECAP